MTFHFELWHHIMKTLPCEANELSLFVSPQSASDAKRLFSPARTSFWINNPSVSDSRGHYSDVTLRVSTGIRWTHFRPYNSELWCLFTTNGWSFETPWHSCDVIDKPRQIVLKYDKSDPCTFFWDVHFFKTCIIAIDEQECRWWLAKKIPFRDAQKP